MICIRKMAVSSRIQNIFGSDLSRILPMFVKNLTSNRIGVKLIFGTGYTERMSVTEARAAGLES